MYYRKAKRMKHIRIKIRLLVVLGLSCIVSLFISIGYTIIVNNKEATQYIISQLHDNQIATENITGIRFYCDWDYEADKPYQCVYFTTMNTDDIISCDWLNGYYVKKPYQYLNLAEHNIIDFKKLSKYFPNITALGIDRGMWFSSIHGIDRFNSLQIINIDLPINIRDISYLTNVKTLRYITLYNGILSNISCINNMPELEYLCIFSCRVSKLGTLNGLPKLKYLNLERNRIRNAEAIANCKSLEVLFLRGNRIKNTDFIDQLPQLRSVKI